MYEEDRQKALALYNLMFDEAEDEQALLQLLVSPTRQAVILARTYDAKERKLQVYAQSREGYAAGEIEDIPPFVLAIDEISRQAERLGGPKPAVSKDQMSLFEMPEDDEEPTPSEAADRDVNETPAEAAEAETSEAAEPCEQAEPSPTEEAAEAADREVEKEAPAAEETAEENSPVPESVKEAEANVNAFLADFAIREEADEKLLDAASEEAPAVPQEELSASADDSAQRSTAADPIAELAEEVKTGRKISVAKLIPYIILAIPLTLIGIALLLIPTLLFLTLAAVAAATGFLAFEAAFGGFSVFADKLVLIGAGLALLALSLLFIWTFIWFLAGAIAGLVRGVFSLGRKWCSKEVAKQ